MRRVIAAITVLLVSTTQPQADHVPKLDFFGAYSLPTGLSIDGVEFGGISALDYDPASGTFLALSDDQGRYGPVRFYRLTIGFAPDAAPGNGIAGIGIDKMVEIRREDGSAFPLNGADPEALRLGDGVLVWGHERDENGVPHAGSMRLDGYQVRSFAVPDVYLPTEGRGVRNNLAFEGLALSVDGKRAIFGIENALRQDGPAADLDRGSPSRLLVIDIASGVAVAEYVYVTEPVAETPDPVDGFRTNGLSELLRYDDDRLLALERSFSAGKGVVTRIFMVDLSRASNIAGWESLEGQSYVPAKKTLVATLKNGDPVDRIDNLESMTFGPEIGGKRSLVLASDNNFNRREQVTQVLVFTID